MCLSNALALVAWLVVTCGGMALLFRMFILRGWTSLWVTLTLVVMVTVGFVLGTSAFIIHVLGCQLP